MPMRGACYERRGCGGGGIEGEGKREDVEGEGKGEGGATHLVDISKVPQHLTLSI